LDLDREDEQMKSVIAIASLCVFFVGCGATNQRGPSSIEISQISSSEAAELVFTRDDSLLYLALSARVFVDGRQILKLSRGDTASIFVEAGDRFVVVDTWSIPGKFSINLNLEKGRTYQFAVSPRSDSFIAGVAFGLIGNVVEDGGGFRVQLIE
jgi:hypothetical protein